MFQILYKYFIINRKAILPGIGVFHIHRQPASFDFSNKVFISPSAEVSFTERARDADKKFYSFIAKEQQTNEAEAVRHFSNFTQSLKENLHANGMVELPGFGTLSTDVAGTLQFKPARQLPSFFKDVAAERTIREVSEEPIVHVTERKDDELSEVVIEETEPSNNRKSYWWVFAIILAAGAIAAIFYYYNQNGSLR